MYSFEHTRDANAGRSPDEVDALLRRYFRSQMPSPWPTLKPPARSRPSLPVTRPARGSQLRSRLALAATLAVFGLGSLFLSDLVRSPGTAPGEAQRDFYSTPRYEQQILNDQKAREMGVKIEDQGIVLDEDGTAAIKVTAQPSK
jgi:hypothetical protein